VTAKALTEITIPQITVRMAGVQSPDTMRPPAWPVCSEVRRCFNRHRRTIVSSFRQTQTASVGACAMGLRGRCERLDDRK